MNKSDRFKPGILLVEDDPLTREQLFDLLRNRSRYLRLAENGEQGLKIYEEIRPDVVITDILMPVMNGLDMARRILKLSPSARIIMITAYSDIDNIEVLEQMPVDYLLKPVDIDELFLVINRRRQEILLADKKPLPPFRSSD